MAECCPRSAVVCVTEDGEELNAEAAVFKDEDLFLGVEENGEHSIALSPVELVLEHNTDVYQTEYVPGPTVTSGCAALDLFTSSNPHNLLQRQDGSHVRLIEANNNHHQHKGAQQLLVIAHEPPKSDACDQIEDDSHTEQQLLVWATDQAVEEEVYVVDEGSGSVTLEMLHSSPSDPSQLNFVRSDEQFLHMLDSTSYAASPSDLASPTSTSFKPCPEPSTRAATPGKGNARPRKSAATRFFKCEYCEKSFSTNYSLSCHTRIHTKEAPYHCPIEGCSKKFKINGDLAKHIRSHTGERPFVCEICGRGFTTGNILKVHVRVHTGERPYECKEANCGKRFSSITNFNNHMRIHRGEKPYACAHEGCGRRFTEYSSLYKHRLVHDDSSKFHCPYCNKTYRQAASFQHHLNSVHGGAPCGRCGTVCRCGPPAILPAAAPEESDDTTTHIILDPGQEWQEVPMDASEDGSVGPMMRLLQVAGEGGEGQLLLLTHTDTAVQAQ